MKNNENNKASIFMVNAAENRDAKFDKSLNVSEWNITEADAEWKPQDGIPESGKPIDIILVFAKRYKEKETLALCREIRANGMYDSIVLFGAISMYEMPLGNEIKRLDNSETIFTPITKEDLTKKIKELNESVCV